MDGRWQRLARTHYENFPVGSRFIPARYREAIHRVYAFARVADDIADEGLMDAAERRRQLAEWETLLLKSLDGAHGDDFFSGLASDIRRHNIPVQHFRDLISAFMQDAENPAYDSFDEVLDYCRRSANPVGRILLAIFDSSHPRTEILSDHICTALQLTNFLQDISVDTGRNRVYIPSNELADYGLDRAVLAGTGKNEAFIRLMMMQVDRTRRFFDQGKDLCDVVHKDLRFELKMIWHGGIRILEKIEAMGYDTRTQRPALTAFDFLLTFLRALR